MKFGTWVCNIAIQCESLSKREKNLQRHPVSMLQDQKLQRAIGKLALTVSLREDGHTRLDDLREEGSFRVIFPRSRKGQIDAVILNTAGGIAGGDRYTVEARAGEDATLNITTQAAERAYGVADNAVGHLHSRLSVAKGARINWLPQETILFDQCRLSRKLDVDLEGDATFLMVEPLIFGREASGEHVRTGFFQDRVRIFRDKHPIYHDGLQLDGAIAERLRHACVAGGARAMASLVFSAPNAEQYLTDVRHLLPKTAGASLLTPTLLNVRIVAIDGFALRHAILPILNTLTDNTVPKNWRL